MANLQDLMRALVLGVPPGLVIGFLVGYSAGKRRLLERYLGIEVGWGPKKDVA